MVFDCSKEKRKLFELPSGSRTLHFHEQDRCRAATATMVAEE